jgi:2',3'-cyclic-nucleotide 2'-phosphodiesterase (5'-nucleotidase family)
MNLHLIHTNDLHNRFPERTINEIRTQNSLLLDSGDALQGSNLVYHFKEPVLRKMRKAGYAAMAMGNREFHYLRRCLENRFSESDFPILAANLVDLREKVKIQDSFIYCSPDLKDPQNISNPQQSCSGSEVRIGVFGLTVPQYPENSRWEKITGWRFFSPIESAKKAVAKFRDAGVQLVFCLSHSGFHSDCVLAEQVAGIDLILGGHSHTILKEPHRIGSTLILQTGSHGRFVGSWNLFFEIRNGNLQSWKIEGGLISGFV